MSSAVLLLSSSVSNEVDKVRRVCRMRRIKCADWVTLCLLCTAVFANEFVFLADCINVFMASVGGWVGGWGCGREWF
jgi:hypothetical protein